jgi:hypothetical protein
LTTTPVKTTPREAHEALAAAAFTVIERFASQGADSPRAASAGPPLTARRNYRELRDDVRALVDGTSNPVGTELLAALLDLDTEIDADPSGMDHEWTVRRAADHVQDLIHVFLDKEAAISLQDPPVAVTETLAALEGTDQATLAAVFGVTPRTIRTWQSAPPQEIRRNPDRAVVIAEIVRELRGTMSARGVILWLQERRTELDGQTPLEAIEHDPIRARETLTPLTLAARAQLGV